MQRAVRGRSRGVKEGGGQLAGAAVRNYQTAGDTTLREQDAQRRRAGARARARAARTECRAWAGTKSRAAARVSNRPRVHCMVCTVLSVAEERELTLVCGPSAAWWRCCEMDIRAWMRSEKDARRVIACVQLSSARDTRRTTSRVQHSQCQMQNHNISGRRRRACCS